MNAKAEVVEEAPTAKYVPTRDEIRSKLLGNEVKPEFELITVFDTEIELRQPTFRDLMKVREIADTATRSVEMIVQYAFVPGTDERIFEAGDRETILNWPFGADLVKVNTSIANLTGIDIEAIEEELDKDPLVGP